MSGIDSGAADPAGPHTEMKLAVWSRYVGYRTPQGKGGGFLHATQKATRRRGIDGYAGIGRCDFGNGHVRDGTALIALDASVPRVGTGAPVKFTHLTFVEIDPGRAAILQQRVDQRADGGRARVVAGDFNEKVAEILQDVEDRTPTVAILDPYDLDDLRFPTIRTIATWHAPPRRRNRIELFVGLQIGRVRRLRREGEEEGIREISPGALEKLDALLGNANWRPTLDEWLKGDAEWAEVVDDMRSSFEAELRALGYGYLRHCYVPEHDPIYALVFASDSKEADTIMKGAIEHWRRDPKLRQQGWL